MIHYDIHLIQYDTCWFNLIQCDIRRYERACAGELPTKKCSIDALMELCSCLVIVQSAPDASVCIECDANPFTLMCACKGYRKIGICSHVLACTHRILKTKPPELRATHAECNLNLLTEKLSSKKGAKWIKGKTPKHMHHMHIDSSGEENYEETMR